MQNPDSSGSSSSKLEVPNLCSLFASMDQLEVLALPWSADAIRDRSARKCGRRGDVLFDTPALCLIPHSLVYRLLSTSMADHEEEAQDAAASVAILDLVVAARS